MEYTVYRLENVVTKKNYIGMTSQEPKERWWGEYTGKMREAIDVFPFDLCWKKHIEFQTPNKEQALELESELMKWYDSVDNGYNTSSYGSGHYNKSEETRRKMAETRTGKHHSKETRNKISESQTGENNSMYGKHHSEESKNRIRENSPLKKPILQFSKYGEFIAEYNSVMEAERHTGCHNQSICYCCKGKRKTCGGYIWKYKED